ncbi:MAG: alpha/beta fold hydrolase [Anaerolineales bacterium]
MPSIKTADEATIHYDITGTGPPLLLLHGFMGTGATEFPGLRAHLARRYRVITPDLRGYGASAPKPRTYGPDFYERDAHDMVALLAHLDVSGAGIVGYSDGGEVALWLPLLAPERVRAVAAWGAVGHFSPQIKPGVLAHLAMPWRTPALDALHGAEYIGPMTQRWVQAMLAIIDQGGDITFSRAGEITCPVLMMLGDADNLNPVEQARSMAEALPAGRLEVFKRTGHAIHTERPRRFRRQLGLFLKTHLA